VAIRSRGPLLDWLREHEFPVQLNPMPWLNRWKPWSSVYHAWRLARWAKRQGAELIHCYEHELWPFTSTLRRFLPGPAICHCHFLIEASYAQWAFRKRRCRPDAMLWTSDSQAAACQDAVASHVGRGGQHIIPLGIDLRRFGTRTGVRHAVRRSWGAGPETVVIGTASALRERKRVGDFIQMVRTLLNRHNNVLGVYAGGQVRGEEHYGQEFAGHLRELEKTGRFRWLGDVEPVEPVLHGIDIYVSTSDYETFGMAVCEAMACKRPVAAYRGGSVQEVVVEGGVVVADRDVSALIDAVDGLIRSRHKREELGERGRRRVVEQYDPAVSHAQLSAIYEGLLSRPTAKDELVLDA
jgi:glycosyltransferase involved in cell wall biosynthesis